MVELLLVSLYACLAAGIAALVAYVLASRHARRVAIQARFRELIRAEGAWIDPGAPRQVPPGLQLLRAQLWRAGIAPAIWQLCAVTAILTLGCGLGYLRSGPLGAACMAALVLGALWGGLAWLAARRRRQVLEQLPPFLEHVLRAVSTGTSVPSALQAAAIESEEPLRGLFERVNRQVQLGANLEDALDQPAAVLTLREFSMVALTVRVNQKFGGNIRDLLRSVITTIEQRERARREFRALTGETRISAWVLGLLPAAIALYLVSVNPDYLDRMRQDATGQTVLSVAFGLQVLGSLLLWRMVRSI